MVFIDFLFKIKLIHQYQAAQFMLSPPLFLFYQSFLFMEGYQVCYRLILPHQYLKTLLKNQEEETFLVSRTLAFAVLDFMAAF